MSMSHGRLYCVDAPELLSMLHENEYYRIMRKACIRITFLRVSQLAHYQH